jgi:hypothetical protein
VQSINQLNWGLSGCIPSCAVDDHPRPVIPELSLRLVSLEVFGVRTCLLDRLMDADPEDVGAVATLAGAGRPFIVLRSHHFPI